MRGGQTEPERGGRGERERGGGGGGGGRERERVMSVQYVMQISLEWFYAKRERVTPLSFDKPSRG